MKLRVLGIASLILSIVVAGLPRPALAQDDGSAGPVLRNAPFVKQLLGSRAHRLGVSAGPDPDTVYVGKSYTNHTGPQNYWNIYTGTYLPGLAPGTNALWDWDNTVGIQAPDSLMGWWPVHRRQLRDQPAELGQAHVRRGQLLARGSGQRRRLRGPLVADQR